ncbi:MAG: SCO family protein [Dokdonella sp.]
MTLKLPRGRISTGLMIVIAALAAGLGLWFGNRWFNPEPPQLQAALLYPQPRAVPEFTLQRANGGTLTLADWKGRWNLVFIGFTHCPDVCPTALAILKQAWTRWQQDGHAKDVQVNFISVDPTRDTPDVLKTYVGFFSPDFVGATGNDEQLEKLSKSLGLVYARHEGDGGGYSVDHSANILIIDPQGRLAGMFRPGQYDADKLVADMDTLIERSAP